MSNVVLQDTFNQYTPLAYAGQVHDPMDLDIVTRLNMGDARRTVSEDPYLPDAQGIPFGRAVMRSATDGVNGCTVCYEAGAKFYLGVAIRSVAVPEKAESGNLTPTYHAGEEVGILQGGRVWLVAMNDVTAGEDVLFISKTPVGKEREYLGGFGMAGLGTELNTQFSTTAPDEFATKPLAFGQWQTNATAGSVAMAYFDGLNAFVAPYAP